MNRLNSESNLQFLKKGHPSNRILKSGSALFITSKKNAAFAQGQKTSKNLFPIPNSPAQSSPNVKLIVFPKMNKVVVFDKLKEDEMVARVKLDMNSALRDRTEGQNCYSVQSYEPNDQSEGGRRHPSNRILKSGSALFITSKKNAAFAQGQKTSKNLFPIPNSPAQSSSNVKLIVFPKMNKVIIFDKLKEDEVVARVKLDMNSALRDRTEGQNCYSVQSYEPNDQSEGGRISDYGNGEKDSAASYYCNEHLATVTSFLSSDILKHL
uniref:Uncharacterized protein n=1 Tax=Romanomermis culicivorax TaxID=13658 RepID=A0A915KRT6_ROMCU